MSDPKFAFYSLLDTGAGTVIPKLDPDDITPLPATVIKFDQDSYISGNYDPSGGSMSRGSDIPTLGGSLRQDFTAQITDKRILLSDEGAFFQTTITAIQALFDLFTEFYFTDGHNCWKVRFIPKTGFLYKRNMYFANASDPLVVFDYTIILIPTSLEI